MSKIFEEALADAKKLKEVAEENAKQAILESVTPKIKEFIESQILEQDKESVSDNLEDDDIQKEEIKDLMEMLGINEIAKNIQNKNAIPNSHSLAFQNLNESDKTKMKNLIKKINKQKNNLQQRSIINSVNTIQENNLMSNREKFYEVDLSLLRESVDDAAYEIASKEIDAEEEANESNFLDMMSEEEEIGEMAGSDSVYEEDELQEHSFLFEQDEEESEEESEEAADLDEAGGEGVEIPLDLAQELQDILDAELGGGGEEAPAATELETLDMGDEESEEESEEAPEMESLEEQAFDIDPDILREELANIRSMLGEGKTNHHFGGKGEGKAGVDGAYGGKGHKNAGAKGAFGGGSEGQDVFVTPPSTLKKLNEAIQELRKLSRMNRAQNEKLNKYRGAVHTLREQLEDLNLFNAKLLYVNKLLQNKNLNESQKKSVIKALDEAKSLGETKALFNSLTESLATPKTSLNESKRFGSSSRATTSGSDSKNRTVGESDRWARLAGLK